MFELFDHTADLGLRVAAPDLPGLFRDAAAGLLSTIVEPRAWTPASHRQFTLGAERLDFLLVDWLAELLYVFETEHLVLGAFEVEVDDRRPSLTARAASRPLDLERDRLLHEVKAVTYHALRVDRTRDGWLAELVLDI